MLGRHRIRCPRLTALTGFLILAAGSAQAAQDSGWEPVSVRNLRPVALAFLRMPPPRPVLPAGAQEWDFALSVANDFRSLPGLEEDSEVTRLVISHRVGLAYGAEWWIEGALLARSGGVLDGLIDWWHANVLRWSDPLRVAAPRGRSLVSATGRYEFASAAGLGDVAVGWARSLGPRAGVQLALKLPTGDPAHLLGSGGVDFGVSLSYAVPLNPRLCLQLQLGGVFQGRAKRLPGARTLVDQQCVALVWRPNSRDAWIAQWQSEGAPITTGVAGADGPHRIVAFGFRRKLDDRRTLELHFTEDRDLLNGRVPAIVHIGPDFGFGIRMSIRS